MVYSLSNQQKKALDIDRSIALTANAGSGKTFILSKRFLETVAKKNISVNQIAAITFTEKAASELLGKISSDIDDYLSKDIPKQLKSRLQKFRDLILSSKISTIHSFCSEILKKYPIEAEVDIHFSIIEESEKKELINSAIDNVITQMLNDESIKDVLRIFGKDHLFNKLEKMIGKRFLTNRVLDRFYLNDFDLYKNEIDKLYIDYFMSDSPQRRLVLLLDYLRGLLPYLKNEIRVELSNLLGGIEQTVKEQKFIEAFELLSKLNQIVFQKSWGSIRVKSFIKKEVEGSNFKILIDKLWTELDYFLQFLEGVNYNEKFERQRYIQTQSVIKIYRSALENYEELKSSLGYLDYDDLLIKTYELLKNSQVKNELSSTLKYILVDEFQDTDQLQYSILKKITNDLDDEHFIFIVGDEKQSIYGFRNAEIKIFQEAKQEISQRGNFAGGFTFDGEKIKYNENESVGIISLPENYRLLPNLIAFNNYIFHPLLESKIILNSKNFDGEVAYSELVHGRNNNSGGVVELLITDSDSENEVEKIADKIQWLINSDYKIFKKDSEGENEIARTVEYRDIGILFRERSYFKDFERVFASRKIPYTITGGKGYFQTEELTDWIQYFKFLADPKNDVAFAAILRSPFYVISDNLLYDISRIEDADNLYEKLLLFSKRNNDPEINRIATSISQHVNFSGRLTIPILIQIILRDTFYLGTISTNERRSQISANVLKLLDNAREFESKGFSDLYDFAEYLKSNWSEETEVSEAPINELSNSVKLLTIHQAKGLEFPVVFIPISDLKIKEFKLNYGHLEVEENTGLIFKIATVEGNIHTKSSVLGYHIKSKNNYNEALRVFYVALTRARDYLIVSGTVRNNLINRDSLLGMILKILDVTDYNSDKQIERNVKLRRLIKKNEKIKEIVEDFKLKVNIKLSSEEPKTEQRKNAEIHTRQKRTFNLAPLTDWSKGELFTATQMNTFSLCPTKYLIKYEIGCRNNFYEKFSTDASGIEANLSGARYGNLFHRIMEKISSDSFSDTELNGLVNTVLIEFPEINAEENRQKLISDIKKISQTEIFKSIFSKQNFLVEHEIISRFRNHYLRGIIDRIVIENEMITIIDFKTDEFDIKDFEKKTAEYLTQMGFYSVLVKNYFRMNKKIELILFFVRYPEYVFRKVYTTNDVNEYEKIFSNYIDQIVSRDFEKNLSHCRSCEYYFDGECLI
jgi:ATP-dependent helicase/nuclease subunit A